MMYIVSILIAFAIIFAYRQGIQDGKNIAANKPLADISIKPIANIFNTAFGVKSVCTERQEVEEKERQRQAALQRQHEEVDSFCNRGGLA